MTNHERLDSFRSLEPGWVPGAPAIDPLVIDAVKWLLDRLPPAFADAAYIYPTGDGKIEAEWAGRPLEFALEFRSPHEADFYLFQFQHPEIECIAEGTFNLAMNLTEITDLIRRTLEP